MDPENQGVVGAGADNQPVDQPTTETKTTSTEEVQQGTGSAPVQASTTDEKQAPSPRLQQRLSELTKARKAAEAEAEQAKAQLASQQLPPWLQQQSPTWDDLVGEVDPNELRKRVAQEAEAIAETKLMEFQAKQREEQQRNEQKARIEAQIKQLEEDFQTVEATYPRLNPDSDTYDEAYTKEVASLYEQAAKSNPDLRLSDFVASIERIAGRVTDRSLADTKQVLADQAAQGALVGGDTRQETLAIDTDAQLYQQAQQTGDWAALIKHRVFGSK